MNFLFKFKLKNKFYQRINEDYDSNFIRYLNKKKKITLKRLMYRRCYKNLFFPIQRNLSRFFIRRLKFFISVWQHKYTLKEHMLLLMSSESHAIIKNNFQYLKKYLPFNIINNFLDTNYRKLFFIVTRTNSVFYYFKYWLPTSKRMYWLHNYAGLPKSKQLKKKKRKKKKFIFQIITKIKFQRRNRHRFNTYNNQASSYKGWFYNICKLYLNYGLIDFKKIKNFKNQLKYKYNKNKIFVSLINGKLFLLLYQLWIVNNIKSAFFYIKKYGIKINLKRIYKPNYSIREFDLIIIDKKLLKMIKHIRKRKKFFFITSFFRHKTYNIIINFKIFAFIILFKQILFNISSQKTDYVTKKKANINHKYISRYFLNSASFLKRRK